MNIFDFVVKKRISAPVLDAMAITPLGINSIL